MSGLEVLVIGAMKAGTTMVFSDLSRVTSIDLLPKECGRFIGGQGGRKGGSDHRVRVEVCAEYSMRDTRPNVPRRVADQLGTAIPIIYMVRKPLERLSSHLRHLSSLGVDSDELMSQMLPGSEAVANSQYGYQLGPWLEAGFTSLHIIDFHKYAADRIAGLNGLLNLIGLEDEIQSEPEASRVNSSEQLRSARGFVRPIVRSPLYGSIKTFIPNSIRERMKQSALTRGATEAPPFPAHVEQQLEEVFEADRQLLAQAGIALPGWLHDSGTRPRDEGLVQRSRATDQDGS